MGSHSYARDALRIVIALSLLVATIVVFTAQDVGAVPGSVTGTIEIKDAGVTSGYGGVTVSAVPSGGSSAAGSTVSDPDGSYTLSVEEGLYSIVAEPPDADGFTPATQTGVSVPGGGSKQADFLFIVPETRVTVSGTITSASGGPVAGAEIILGDRTDTTNSSGSYSVDVLPRPDHAFSVNASGLSGFPATYALSTTSATVNISTTTTIDVTLPVSAVSVEIVDTNGDAVPLSGATTGGSTAGPTVAGVATSINASVPLIPADAAGKLTMNLPSGTFEIAAYPDSSLGLLPGSESVTVPTATTVTIVLDASATPTKTQVTGRILHSSGTPLPDVQLVVFRGGTGVSNGTGQLDFESDVVEDRLEVRGLGGANLPMRLTMTTTSPVQLTSPTFAIGDITVPTEQTTIVVIDPDGNPVEGAVVDLTTSPTATGLSIGPYPATGTSSQDFFATGPSTDANGKVDLWLLETGSSQYEVEVSPGACSTGDTWELNGGSALFLAGDTVTVHLTGTPCGPVAGDPVTVTGTITYLGAPLADTEFSVSGDSFNDSGLADTEADGTFAFEDPLIPDDYEVSVYAYLADNLVINASTNAPAITIPNADPYNIPAIDITSLADDLTELVIRVVDQADRPVEGVIVSIDPVIVTGLTLAGVDADGSSNTGGKTDANGDATLRLFSTDGIKYGKGYRLAVSPPTGFEPLVMWDVEVPAAGSSITIKLVNAHAAPVTSVAFDSVQDGDGAYPDPSVLTLAATAATGFSIDSIEYQLDAGPVTIYTGPLTVTGTGAHTVSVWATDSGSVSSAPVVTAFQLAVGDVVVPPSTTTTTSVAVTPPTTTIPPTTTTSLPDPSTTTTVAQDQGTTTTTMTSDSTSTTVAAAPAASTTTTVASEEILPVTGPALDFGILALIAGGMLLVGLLAVRATRDEN
jgi:hypothetical protein